MESQYFVPSKGHSIHVPCINVQFVKIRCGTVNSQHIIQRHYYCGREIGIQNNVRLMSELDSVGGGNLCDIFILVF